MVLLTGEAPDASIQRQAERMARSTGDVRGTYNEVAVTGNSAMSARVNDSYITFKVKARFADNRQFNPAHVKVVTEASVVYLLGLVTRREADDAVEIARTTSGVEKVVKLFEYVN
jgi:osmotically-inducible protein OsmY